MSRHRFQSDRVSLFPDLRSGWREERIHDVVELRTSNVDKKSEEGQKAVRLCNYIDVYKNDRITIDLDFMEATATEAQIDRFALKVGDVVITKDSETPDDIGVPALVVETAPDLICGYHLTILRPKENDILGGYLFYAVASRMSAYQFYLAANGVTRFGLTYQGTKNLRIAIPAATEQLQIAAFLEWKTGQIDALIARKQELMTKLMEKRIAVITQCVTKGLNPAVTMRDSGIPWLGKVPKHWEVRRLKFAATCNDESLPETTEPDYEIAYVDISSVDLVKGITRVEKIPFGEAPSRARRIAKNGDTIVSTVRTYLKAIAAIRQPPANLIVSTGFAVIRPLRLIDSGFLAYALQSATFVEAVVADSTGVSYPAINPTALICLSIAYPEDKKEQRDIAAFLDSATAELDMLKRKTAVAVERLQEYRTALITTSTSGKIDVRKIAIGNAT